MAMSVQSSPLRRSAATAAAAAVMTADGMVHVEPVGQSMSPSPYRGSEFTKQFGDVVPVMAHEVPKPPKIRQLFTTLDASEPLVTTAQTEPSRIASLMMRVRALMVVLPQTFWLAKMSIPVPGVPSGAKEAARSLTTSSSRSNALSAGRSETRLLGPTEVSYLSSFL